MTEQRAFRYDMTGLAEAQRADEWRLAGKGGPDELSEKLIGAFCHGWEKALRMAERGELPGARLVIRDDEAGADHRGDGLETESSINADLVIARVRGARSERDLKRVAGSIRGKLIV